MSLSSYLKRLWLRALEAVQKEVWASIKEAYRPEELSVPHQFQKFKKRATELHRKQKGFIGATPAGKLE
ncbi:Carbamoyl-phosphate synthase [ammonia], mitochondrial [Manis javanica]|nr:Carbamoyl-phosphate synthase [ammonia], mitochondrial [Manis javanica]